MNFFKTNLIRRNNLLASVVESRGKRNFRKFMQPPELIETLDNEYPVVPYCAFDLDLLHLSRTSVSIDLPGGESVDLAEVNLSEHADVANALRREYNEIANSYCEVTSIHAEKEHRRIRNAIELVGSKRGIVIDLGIAGARDAEVWLKEGFTLQGLDLSDEMLRIARAAHPLAGFYEGDMVHTKIKPESALIIWASSSIQHIGSKHIMSLLRKIAQGLEPGGIFYANYRSPKQDVPKEGIVASHEYGDKDGNPRTTHRFIAHYSKSEMEAMVSAVGLEVLESEVYREIYAAYDAEKAAYLPSKNIIFARKSS